MFHSGVLRLEILQINHLQVVYFQHQTLQFSILEKVITESFIHYQVQTIQLYINKIVYTKYTRLGLDQPLTINNLEIAI